MSGPDLWIPIIFMASFTGLGWMLGWMMRGIWEDRKEGR